MRLILTVLLILTIIVNPLESFFLPVVQAVSSDPDIGLVAWNDVGQTIDLNKARKLFTTVYSETPDEIVGVYSTIVDTYGTTEDMNLYINKNGLIAGFYNSYEPASKTILWNSDKLFFSKLASIITVGQSLGYTIDIKNVKYYDYRHPTANRILIVTQSLGEQTIGNFDYGGFKLNIPNYATIYETSYSIYLNDIYNSQPSATIGLDGTIIGSISGVGTVYDKYSSYIPTDLVHEIGVMSVQGAQAAVAMVIIYKDDNVVSQNSNTIDVSNADYSFDNAMEEPIISSAGTTYTPDYTAPVPTRIPAKTPKTVVTMPIPTVQITEEIPEYTPEETPEDIPKTPKPTEKAPSKPPKVSVDLHGERTNIELGQQSLLKGSIVSFNTNKDKMHAQVIIIPPSGVSVVAADFVKSPIGQYTSDFDLDPGKGKDIEVTIIPNEVGEFKVTSKVTYYFGDDKDDNGYEEIKLDIKTKPKGSSSSEDPTSVNTEQRVQPVSTTKEEPGFGIISVIIILIVCFFITKKK